MDYQYKTNRARVSTPSVSVAEALHALLTSDTLQSYALLFVGGIILGLALLAHVK